MQEPIRWRTRVVPRQKAKLLVGSFVSGAISLPRYSRTEDAVISSLAARVVWMGLAGAISASAELRGWLGVSR
uniref:Uncharacterized protein n=1 Tax=Vespula pensylvanica TaxID=30213 RepID=A0A834KQL6_VESPE|nr:hypothetical protein H0235_013615 [Vespula pensylvanica]